MLQVDQHHNVSVLVMHHGKANALDVEFCEALDAKLVELRDSSTSAIVLTGEGRIFSAGVDLLRILEGGPAYSAKLLSSLSKVFVTLFDYPKPVVAAINGHAIAGGCVLACAADQRIMVQGSSRIGVPELLVGVPLPTCAVEIMRFVTAPQHLPTLLYGGKTLSPDEATAQGLVDAVAPAEKLLDNAVATAESLASLPAAAFALTKQQLREPVMQRIRDEGPRLDALVQEIWARPESIAAIRDYVARTFKPSVK